MSSHSIPEAQEAVPSAPVTPAITPDIEIDPDALSVLRDFFLLLDEWDRQGGSREEVSCCAKRAAWARARCFVSAQEDAAAENSILRRKTARL